MSGSRRRRSACLALAIAAAVGAVALAAPGPMPAAHAANANLFVSAEDPRFDSRMAGPQVVEVVVTDLDIRDTDEAKGEPDVTVNGKDLRMVQAVDGSWYGYFADRSMATAADATTAVSGQGLDFGQVCMGADLASAQTAIGVSLSDAGGVAVPAASCTSTVGDGSNNVVREAKDVNTNVPQAGQIGINTGLWPFIQLYTLNPTGNVVVQYNRGGGAQTTTLTFDTVDDFAGLVLDRAKYTTGAQVHATITDRWLNIDPTDEDSWTFGTLDGTTYYQVFDENGNAAGDMVQGGAIDISGSAGGLMCGDGCILLIDPRTQGEDVLTLQDTDDSILLGSGAIGDFYTSGIPKGSGPVTFTEHGPNSGIFGSYDESDQSGILITSDAKRGTSATIDYNETPVTVLVGFEYGTVDMRLSGGQWNSGQEIPVVVVDGDANKNSRLAEDLVVSDPGVGAIPTVVTGDPFTLGEGDAAAVLATVVGPGLSIRGQHPAAMTVQPLSDRAVIVTSGPVAGGVNSVIIDYGTDAADLKATLHDASRGSAFRGFNFYSQDIRSLDPGGGGAYDVWLLHGHGGIIGADGLARGGLAATQIATGIGAQSGLVPPAGIGPPASAAISALDDSAGIGLLIRGSAPLDTGGARPVTADILSYGFLNDGRLAGERISNQIVRIEAEETGPDTGVFEGSLEYSMINQLSVLDPSTYSGLATIADDPRLVAVDRHTDEDSVRVGYLDTGADGVSVRIADQQEIRTHTGAASLDRGSYGAGDTVTVILDDPDLNADSRLIDIYTTVGPGDAYLYRAPGLQDVVGSAEFSVALGDGSQLGRLLDITLDDIPWTTPAPGTCAYGLGTYLEDRVAGTGLAAAGFALVETDRSSGTFTGSFKLPQAWCRPGASAAEATAGTDLGVRYADFRDAAGTFTGTKPGPPAPPAPTVTVSGRAFEDTDRDGSPGPGERGMRGITVLVHDYSTGTGTRVHTGSDGGYAVPGIRAGHVALSQIVLPIPAGHLPSGGASALFAYTPPDLAGGSAAVIDFPLYPVRPDEEGTVTFEVYDDLDGDGARDAGEPGVPGATVFTFELLTYEADVQVTGPDGSTTHPGLIPDVVLAQISYSDPATGALLLPGGFTRITTQNGGAEYVTVAPGATHTVRIGLGR